MGELGESYREYRQELKDIKGQRLSKFESDILPLVKCDVYVGKNNQFVFDSELGVVDYYPKSKRLLFRNENKWINNGDNWIKENLL